MMSHHTDLILAYVRIIFDRLTQVAIAQREVFPGPPSVVTSA